MSFSYKLKGLTPVLAEDGDYSAWEKKADRRVAFTRLENGTIVSTVFLAMDHAFMRGGPPILFESMSFREQGSYSESDCSRCSTWRQALKMHMRMVQKEKRQGD